MPQAEEGISVICLYMKNGLCDTLPTLFLWPTLGPPQPASSSNHLSWLMRSSFHTSNSSFVTSSHPPLHPPHLPELPRPVLSFAPFHLPVSVSIFCSWPTALPPLQVYLSVHTRSWLAFAVLLLHILGTSWNFNMAKNTTPNFVWPKIRTFSCLRTCSGVSHRGSILVLIQFMDTLSAIYPYSFSSLVFSIFIPVGWSSRHFTNGILSSSYPLRRLPQRSLFIALTTSFSWSHCW